MTDAEWLSCTNPSAMLEFLQDNVSERKVRLFLVACCRRLFSLLPEPCTRKVVRTAERYADGEVTAEKLHFALGSARRAAGSAQRERRKQQRDVTARDYALWLVCLTGEDDPVRLLWSSQPVHWSLPTANQVSGEAVPVIDEPGLLRCIFGNPFRPLPLDPALLTPTVTLLGRAGLLLPTDETVHHARRRRGW